MQIIIPNVIVKHTETERGLGVYANKDISSGEVVEVCPVITFNLPFNELPINLKTRVFDWGVLADHSDKHAIALGMGSLYNSSNPSNLRYEAVDNNFIKFIAVQDISCGEELTINYSGFKGSHLSDDDNWFERTGVKPIG